MTCRNNRQGRIAIIGQRISTFIHHKYLGKNSNAMKKLIERLTLAGKGRAENLYGQLGQLLHELERRDLPAGVTAQRESDIERLNSMEDSSRSFAGTIKKTENKIIKLVEKELKIVPKNHYRKLWFVLGMSAFGMPIGVAFGLIVGNIGLLGLGLPIGMGIGLAVGSAMDQKALKEGRQLDFEVKY